jgi:hypothetical protein
VNTIAWGLVARPYRLTLKYLDYKKEAYPYVHVRMFQVVVRANGKTLKEYIINAFDYTLRETTSN